MRAPPFREHAKVGEAGKAGGAGLGRQDQPATRAYAETPESNRSRVKARRREEEADDEKGRGRVA